MKKQEVIGKYVSNQKATINKLKVNLGVGHLCSWD